MKRYKIIDNFLSDAEFIELTNNILSNFNVNSPKPDFNWVYSNQTLSSSSEPNHLKKVTDIEILNPIHDWYFQHVFWSGIYQSPAMENIAPLLSKINPLTLFGISANFTVQQPERKGRSLFHVDYKGPPFTHSSMITSINRLPFS